MTYEEFVTNKMAITRRPVEPRMVYEGARAAWERHRDVEGRVPWEDAAPWHVEPYIREAQTVLEAALCIDADFPEGNRATELAFNSEGGSSMTYRTMLAGQAKRIHEPR